MNSCDFRRVEAKTKCSAWDDMEAEPWPPGSSSRLRLGRNGQRRSPFLETAPSGFISKASRAFSPWQKPCVRGPHLTLNRAERERGSLPQQPSPASPPNMSDVEETLATQPPSKHGCLFKEEPQKREHVGQLAAEPFKKSIAPRRAGWKPPRSAIKVYAFRPKRAEQLE